MERLTEKLDKMIWFKDQGLKIEPCEMNAHHCRMILEKLADYEDLEEQGLLVRLPCKEAYSQCGDYVFLIDDYEIVKCVHCGLGIDPLSGKAYITLATDEKIFPRRSPDPEQDLEPADWCTNTTDAEVNEIGKTLFWTLKEAEKKLEEMNNDKT